MLCHQVFNLIYDLEHPRTSFVSPTYTLLCGHADKETCAKDNTIIQGSENAKYAFFRFIEVIESLCLLWIGETCGTLTLHRKFRLCNQSIPIL